MIVVVADNAKNKRGTFQSLNEHVIYIYTTINTRNANGNISTLERFICGKFNLALDAYWHGIYDWISRIQVVAA